MNVAKVKASVRVRDGNRCRNCLMTNEAHAKQFGRGLHVHRLIPGGDYVESNCVTLCKSCHWELHRGENSPKALGARYNAEGCPATTFIRVKLEADLLRWLRRRAKRHYRRMSQELQVIIEAAAGLRARED
jgi:hypothetical protein